MGGWSMSKVAKPKYVADLETTTDPEDCRAWAYGIVKIGEEDVKIGNSLDELMNIIMSSNKDVYFHNAGFDMDFIFVWLYEHGYTYHNDNKNMPLMTFNSLISDKGKFYTTIIQGQKAKVRVIDSLKILNFSVADIAKAFNLPDMKGEIDYDLPRPVGWKVTTEEAEYIRKDVIIVSQALSILFSQGLTKLTQGSNALADFKKMLGKNQFKHLFPIPPVDMHDDIKPAYRGGFTWLNPKYKGKVVGNGLVLDKNSMYPWVMMEKLLPVGEPVPFTGRYDYDKIRPLYVQRLRCQFKLKEGHIPTVQIKYPGPWVSTEYLEDSRGEDVVLTFSNIDLQLFLDHYNIIGGESSIEWMGGYKFIGRRGIFSEYITKWYKVKEESTKTGNKAMRTLAKLMLNALYGKFGTSPHVREKIPTYEDGRIRYVNGEPGQKDAIYIPMALFITSYAREECIRSAQKVYDRFIYADTDSLHLEGLEVPDLDIHGTKLGAWKCEGIFKRGKYLRAKTYVEDIYNMTDMEISGILERRTNVLNSYEANLHITCAGLPAKLYTQVTFDNFEPGAEFFGKLSPKHVKGGTVLVPTTFTIKP